MDQNVHIISSKRIRRVQNNTALFTPILYNKFDLQNFSGLQYTRYGWRLIKIFHN